MNANDVRILTVIGAGTMGHGIAHVAAQMGASVQLYDAMAGGAAAGKDKVAKNLAKGVELGKVSAAERDSALARIRTFDDLAPACGHLHRRGSRGYAARCAQRGSPARV